MNSRGDPSMSTDFTTIAAFRIDEFEIDPAHNLVRYKDDARAVEPKVMAVLCCLAARPGQVLSRQALIDEVWGVAYGGDESLTRAISLLRKALERDDGPDLIKTVPKRGYSLTVPPRPADAATPAVDIAPGRRPAYWLWLGLGLTAAVLAGAAALFLWHPSPPASRIQGIVLLVKPFATDTDPAQASILTDDLTAAVARFDQIKVRKFTQGAATPDTRLNYVYVVTGTVKPAAAGTQLSLQLQDFTTGDAIWSGSEPIAGTADQDNVLSALSAELEPAAIEAAKKAVQRKPVMTLSPWELVLLGTWVPGADQEWPGPPTAQSYWVWDRAIARDPDYALAYASLAQVMASFALFNPPSDTPAQTARAAVSADHALQLAPYDAGVLFQVALYHKYAGHRAQALATFQRVLDLEPDNLMARIERDYAQGQCSTAGTAAIARLKTLNDSLPASNPAHWVILSRMADMSLARGDYAQAAAYARQSRAIVRQVWSSVTLAAADAELGNDTEARQVGLEHQAQWPALDYATFADGPLSRWCLGGDITRARAAFLKLSTVTKTAATAPH